MNAPPGYVWCGKKGDLDLYVTHVRFPDDHADHPALYIRNPNRKIDKLDPITGGTVTGSPAYLLPYRDFWQFRPEDRDRGSVHRIGDMVQALANASVALYGMDVPEYRFRIHDAILEFAEDVKNIRPPEGITAEAWERELERVGLTLRVNGEKVN